jgi:hypothetical protein
MRQAPMRSIWGPLVSGLVATATWYLLSGVGRRPARRSGARRVLIYGLGIRVFAVLLIPGSLFLVYAGTHARPGQTAIWLVLCAGFLAAAVFSAYQAFFVRLEYDEANLYYRSPLVGSHRIPWSEVREVRYSALTRVTTSAPNGCRASGAQTCSSGTRNSVSF